MGQGNILLINLIGNLYIPYPHLLCTKRGFGQLVFKVNMIWKNQECEKSIKNCFTCTLSCGFHVVKKFGSLRFEYN